MCSANIQVCTFTTFSQKLKLSEVLYHSLSLDDTTVQI